MGVAVPTIHPVLIRAAEGAEPFFWSVRWLLPEARLSTR